MLRKLVFSALLIGAIFLIVGLESSLVPLHKEICEKAKDTGAEQCATYNFISYALFKLLTFLDSINTVITAVSTFAVAIFTYTLYKATTGLVQAAKIQSDDLKRSIVAAEQSALAAAVQASVAQKALTDIERPYIFVFNISTLKVEEGYDFDADQTFYLLQVTYSVANYGKIPAIIETAGIGLSVFTEPLDRSSLTSTTLCPLRLSSRLARFALISANRYLGLAKLVTTKAASGFRYWKTTTVSSFGRTLDTADPLPRLTKLAFACDTTPAPDASLSPWVHRNEITKHNAAPPCRRRE